MPRGQKSKFHFHDKYHQALNDSQYHRGAQASAAMEEKPPLYSSLVLQDIPQISSAPVSSTILQEPCTVPCPSTTSEDFLSTRTDDSENSQEEEHLASSEAPPSMENSRSDSLAIKVGLLKQFLLYKYKMKQPILKVDILRIIDRKFHDQFAEILKRSSDRIETVFAVIVKEVDSSRHLYDLVSKLKLPDKGRIRASRGLPKTGFLMTLLGAIFMMGNCASEEDIWKYLKMMRVYPGKKHYIYGEPRKLITQDLVRLKYLEYRQVHSSDPPRYELLWGPQAHAETSKMKVLEFLAKVSDTDPSVFSAQYEEALRDEEERAKHKL